MRWLLGLAVLLATTAGAQQPFEAVVAGTTADCGPNPFGSGRLQWVNPNHVETHPRVDDIASGDGVTVFAIERDAPRVVKIALDGSRVPFFIGEGDQIAVAPTGRVFVATNTSVTRISAGGAQEAV